MIYAKLLHMQHVNCLCFLPQRHQEDLFKQNELRQSSYAVTQLSRPPSDFYRPYAPPAGDSVLSGAGK